MPNSIKPTRIRFAVVAITALMAILLYLDRFCISFAETYIKQDLQLTDLQVSWMLGAFFLSYALFQVPSGWLTDRFGPRLMLTIYVLAWSLCTGLTGAVYGFASLLLLRLGFGLAQAGAYPTGASIVRRWFPLAARGTASSIVSVGGRVGGFLALFATGYLIVWLTPSSTPATITRDDVLDAGDLAIELTKFADDDPAQANAGRKVWKSLDKNTQDLLEKNAALAESAAREQDDVPSSRGEPATKEPTFGDDVHLVVDDFNQVISEPDFFYPDDIGELSLEAEAKRLIRRTPDQRSEAESLRLNRMVLEAICPSGIRRIYVAGWRPMMAVYGSIGIVVALLIWFVCRDWPRAHPRCNEAEVELIEDTIVGPTTGQGRAAPAKSDRIGAVPIVGLLTSPSMWLICLSQWCTNVGWVFVMTWAPRYFQDVHQVPIETRAFMVSIPPLVGWFGMLLGGMWTDRLVSRLGVRWGRVIPMSSSRFLAMAAYVVCLFHPTPWLAVAMFAIVSFATDLGTGAIWAYMQDVGGRHVGSVLGWGNMWGNLGAAITPTLLITVVGEDKQWNLAFITCAIAFLISGLAALGVNANVPIKNSNPR